LEEVVGRLHTAGLETLTVTPPSLDELFLHAYADGGDQA
jgi:ABC-2 type transport system ATP-binding protein